MTNAEKKLLLIDLCSRLPYGVKGLHRGKVHKLFTIDGRVVSNACIQVDGYDAWFSIDTFKPYLRPMSSMTEEEIEEYRNLSDEVIGSYGPYHREFSVHCVRLGIKPDNPHECVDDFLNMEAIDWLNKKGFDYRGLIPMGLALEAPKDMYKIELV